MAPGKPLGLTCMMSKQAFPRIELAFKHWQVEEKERYEFLKKREAELAAYLRSTDFKLSVFLELMEYCQRK